MTPDDPRPRPNDPDAAVPSPLDERASALVDGTTLDEAAAAEARHAPDVVARAAEMDAARSALRDVAPGDAAARSRAIAAALAAYDEAAIPRSPERGGQVADLGARRHRSRPSARWLGAAAAAVLLIGVVVVGLVESSSDDSTSNDVSATALDSADSSSGAAESAEGGGTADDEASAEGPPAGAPEETDESLTDDSLLGADGGRTVDLGTFASADDLLDAASERPEAQRDAAGVLGQGNDADAAAEAAPPPCPAGVPDPFERAGAGPLLVGNGVAAGVSVSVWRVGPPEAARLVVVDAGCAVLAQRPLG